MTFDELLSYLSGYQKQGSEGFSSLPEPVGREHWEKVKDAIKPHFYGKMPDAISDAFYNETKEQLAYRKKVYKNRTKEKLWSAMDDVKRLTMGEKMQIQIDERLSDAILEPQNLGSEFSVERYFFDTVYPIRVLDPNAVLAVCPKDYGIEFQNQPVAVALKIYRSKDIIFETEDVTIVKTEYGKKIYAVFTKTSYMICQEQDDKTMTVLSEYQHGNESKGVYKLQGRLVSDTENGRAFTYYDSDFGHAVSAMDDSEILSNQLKVVTANAAFPTRIIKGLECDSCKGKGKIQRRDPETGEFCYLDAEGYEPDMITCKSCAGRGTLPLGALDQIVVPDNAGFGTEQKEVNLQSAYLAYVNPDISSIVEVRTQKTLAAGEVDEVLNITKPSKFAESGVAKEKDREGKYTFLKNISSTFSKLIENTLHTIADYIFVSPAVNGEIKENTYVTQPISFDIRTAGEVEAEFFSNLEQKPISFRKEQYLDVLRKRYGDDSKAIIIEQTAIEYTKGLKLRTITELQQLNALGIISREQFYTCIVIDTIVDQVYSSMQGTFTDKEAVNREIDRLVSQELATLLPPPAPPVTL